MQTQQQRFTVNGRKHDLRCESAKHENCKCGCLGKFHGTKSGHIARDKKTGLPKYRVEGENISYIGKVLGQLDWEVVVSDGFLEVPLNYRLDIINHSPTGFSWGYYGSGPAQLALALLADSLGNNDELAYKLHQDFKEEMIATIPKEQGFTLSRKGILDWISTKVPQQPV